MALGPIEVVMIAFPENKFTGEIIPELTRLIEQDTISVIDALMVSKTAEGDIVFVEFDELGLDDDVKALSNLFNQADASDLRRRRARVRGGPRAQQFSRAARVRAHVVETVRNAIVAAGGVLALNFRVPGDVVNEIVAELASAE